MNPLGDDRTLRDAPLEPSGPRTPSRRVLALLLADGTGFQAGSWVLKRRQEH